MVHNGQWVAEGSNWTWSVAGDTNLTGLVGMDAERTQSVVAQNKKIEIGELIPI